MDGPPSFPAADSRSGGLRRRLLLPAAWVAVVVAASVVDAGSAGGLAATGPLGVAADKWLHVGGYAVLALLLAAALDARTSRALALAALVAVAVGAGVEAVQYPLAARSADVADAAANAVGASVGVAALAAVRSIAD